MQDTLSNEADEHNGRSSPSQLLAFSFFRPACVRCVLGARANRNRFNE
jgi:hypothetical protein